MTVRLGGLSYIVPVYNEEDAIVDTVEQLSSVLSELGIAYEIIVVNDGSTDDTRDRLEALTTDYLMTLRHPVNTGYGAAIKTGLLAANYEWIGLVDGDGSYEIHDIPNLVEEAELGFDMVIGHRINAIEKDSIFKGVFRRILRYGIWLLVDKKIKDINSGFRIIRKSAVMEFFPFLCSTFSFTTGLTVLFAERGHFTKYVNTDLKKRLGKSKIRTVRDSLRVFQMIIQGIAYFNPMKIFLALGVLMVIGVCVPAMVLAMLEMETLSLYYLIFGSVVILLISLGALGDIIRISSMKRESLRNS
jgi:glycosyltransferase involved in cell wall biosynthesis